MVEKNLLFLSDLHFGINSATSGVMTTAARKRKDVLDAFINEINYHLNLNPGWKPTFIIITGDLVWSGKKQEFDEAYKWIKDLLDILELKEESIIICPGNHDLDRQVMGLLVEPKDRVEADQLLKIENVTKLVNEKQFFEYNSFCRRYHLPILKIGNIDNYLIGRVGYGPLQFVIINSAWYHYNDLSRNKLWLGFNLMNELFSEGVNKEFYNDPQKPINVTLLHHPENWLHDEELNPPRDLANTYEFVASHSHVILSGHEHPKIAYPPDRKYARGWLFHGGATYGRENYWNNVQLIKIVPDERYVQRALINYDPGRRKWIFEKEDERYPFLIELPRSPHLYGAIKCLKLLDIYQTLRDNDDNFSILCYVMNMLIDCLKEAKSFLPPTIERTADCDDSYIIKVNDKNGTQINIPINFLKFLSLWLFVYFLKPISSSNEIPINTLKNIIADARVDTLREIPIRNNVFDERIRNRIKDLALQQNKMYSEDGLVGDYLTTTQINILISNFPILKNIKVTLSKLSQSSFISRTPMINIKYKNFFNHLRHSDLDDFPLSDSGNPFKNMKLGDIEIIDDDFDTLYMVLEILGVIYQQSKQYMAEPAIRNRFFLSRKSLFLNSCYVTHETCNYPPK